MKTTGLKIKFKNAIDGKSLDRTIVVSGEGGFVGNEIWDRNLKTVATYTDGAWQHQGVSYADVEAGSPLVGTTDGDR